MQFNKIKTGHWGIVILLIITAVTYYPALNGRFLLDDFNNLSGLENISTIQDFPNFIFSGSAGPSGRPVSLFTFALQHDAWPRKPFEFKFVNLMIHLGNGILIYFITLFLSGYTNISKKQAGLFASITSFLWLIHPIQISTTLYVIQRMTLLSAFFSLSGILVYLHLWKSFSIRKNIFQLILGTILFNACFLLSVFSKENGILLPVLILAIEFTLLFWLKRPNVWKAWSYIFLLLPLVLFFIYILLHLDKIFIGYQLRSYSMMERLLTETRILFDYIYIILLPNPSEFSLFHDDYLISTGLFSPPATLFSVAGIIMLCLVGLMARKKVPVLAFSILWFLGSHLLESTFLNLELYFEHRNYIGVYGISFLIAWIAMNIHGYSGSRILGWLFITVVLLSNMCVTYMELNLWSKPVEQALVWQKRSPESLRAMEDIGHLYIILGENEKALDTYHKMKNIYPDEVYPYFKIINIKGCVQKTEITDEDWRSALIKAQSAKWYGYATIADIYNLTKKLRKNECESINVIMLIKFILTLAGNPEYSHQRGILHELAAILNSMIGEYNAALNNLDEALILRPTPSKHILKIKILLEIENTEMARAAILDFRKYVNKKPLMYLAYQDSLSAMDDQLENMETKSK